MTDAQLKLFQLITGLTALPIPIVIWYLNKKDSRDALHMTDSYIKRLDLLKKVNEFTPSLSEETKEHVDTGIKKEVEKILEFLNPKQQPHTQIKIEAFQDLRKFRKTFLFFKPASWIVFILQVLFFYCGLFTLLFLFLLIGSFFDTAKTYNNLTLVFFIILIFFSTLTVSLNVAANKYQIKKLAKSPVLKPT